MWNLALAEVHPYPWQTNFARLRGVDQQSCMGLIFPKSIPSPSPGSAVWILGVNFAFDHCLQVVVRCLVAESVIFYVVNLLHNNTISKKQVNIAFIKQ